MASVLDLGLIDQFSSIFSILLVFLVTYAILEVTQILKQNHGVHGLIALIIALLAATQPNALKVVTNFSPFFTILLFFIFFMFMAAMFAGLKPDEVLSAMGGKQGAAVWIVIISIIGLFLVLSGVYGQTFLNEFSGAQKTTIAANGSVVLDTDGTTSTNSFMSNFGNTFFHPKILGMILIMLIGAFAIALLTGGGR